jgi:hypothetical protein
MGLAAVQRSWTWPVEPRSDIRGGSTTASFENNCPGQYLLIIVSSIRHPGGWEARFSMHWRPVGILQHDEIVE